MPKELRQRIVELSDPRAKQAALERRKTRAVEQLEPPPKAADSSKVLSSDSLASSLANEAAETRQSNRPSRFRTDPAHRHANGNGKDDDMVAATIVTAHPVASPMVASGGDSIRTRGLDLEGAHLAHEVPEYLRGRSRDGWLGPLAIGGLVAVLCLLVWVSVGSWDSVRDMLVARVGDQTSSSTSNANGATSNLAKPNENLPAAAGTDAIANNQRPAANSTEIERQENSAAALPDLALPNATAGETLPPSPVAASDAALSWLPIDDRARQCVVLVQTGRQLLRLKPAENIASGQPVFIPPENRPQLELPGGVSWNVAGVSHLSAANASGGLPEVDLQLGRALLLSNMAGASLVLSTPAGKATLQLKDTATKVAIEVSYPAAAFGPVIDRTAHPATLWVMVIEVLPIWKRLCRRSI